MGCFSKVWSSWFGHSSSGRSLGRGTDDSFWVSKTRRGWKFHRIARLIGNLRQPWWPNCLCRSFKMWPFSYSKNTLLWLLSQRAAYVLLLSRPLRDCYWKFLQAACQSSLLPQGCKTHPSYWGHSSSRISSRSPLTCPAATEASRSAQRFSHPFLLGHVCLGRDSYSLARISGSTVWPGLKDSAYLTSESQASKGPSPPVRVDSFWVTYKMRGFRFWKSYRWVPDGPTWCCDSACPLTSLHPR